MTVRAPIEVWPVTLTCATSAAAVAERDMGADGAIGADRHVLPDHRPAFDPRRWDRSIAALMRR